MRISGYVDNDKIKKLKHLCYSWSVGISKMILEAK